MATSSFIEIRNVTFAYDTTSHPTTLLDGLTLRICKGEFVALSGKKGSGKSTLAKLLNALLPPTSGVVLINGMDNRRNDYHHD